VGLRIFLTSNSFVTLISSAAEGVPNEVLGLLFGDYLNDDRRTVIVHQAIPLQIVERTRSSAECKLKHMRRVHNLWDNLTPYWSIGNFHSHPYEPNELLDPSPSKTDKRDMKKGEIGIIVSIKRTPRRRKLKYDETEFRILGAISFFQIEIAAWHCKRTGILEEAQIRCPFADVINLGYRLGLVEKPGLLFSDDTTVSIENMRKLRILISKYERQAFKSDRSGTSETKRKIRILLRKISRENI
jgi:proteasome lid subunit RPN8/RPN11